MVSASPITTEPVPGVIDETAEALWLEDELPVEERRPVAVTELSSYIEMEPATVWPKVALIVSAPELAAVAYQM